MFDLTDLVEFAHDLESAFVVYRDSRTAIDQRVVDLGLVGKDLLAELLDRIGVDMEEATREAFTARTAAVVDGLRKVVGAPASKTPKATASASESAPHHEGKRSFRVVYQPSEDTWRNGTNPLALLQELAGLGELTIVGYSDRIPSIQEIVPDLCYLHWEFLITTEAEEREIRDVFMFIDAESSLDVVPVAAGEYRRIGDILVDRGDLTKEQLEELISHRPPIGELLVQEGAVSEDEIRSALGEQRLAAGAGGAPEEERQARGESTFIKVPTSRLDRLVNLVGEFVSLQGQLSLSAERLRDRDFLSQTEQFERLVRESRELSMEMHMVPVETLFAPFRRLVRDLARELDKRVLLSIEGAETELDKNMVESLRDPLMHIVRNSIDHGIETEATRREQKKQPQGRLRLSAGYSGAFVVIRVEDDGAGVNAERIRARAIERGLIGENEELTLEQTHELLFAPGFSTAQTTSHISGRGVGMDVVRRNVERLNGSVLLHSEKGKGTTIDIRIPLTLAIVEGLLAEIGDVYYLINIAYIRECLASAPATTNNGQAIIDYRGEAVPLVDLADEFGVGRSSMEAPVVVIATGEQTVALRLTRIHGNYQSVVKPLGPMFEHVEGVSGAVFLADGTPALMLDIERLVRRRMRTHQHRGRTA